MLTRERFARIYAHQEADRVPIIAEIDRLVPKLKERDGYIFSSDHSIPNSVSLENFRAIVDEIKRVGRY